MSFSTQQPFEASLKDKILGLIVLVVVALAIYWYESKTDVLDAQKWLPAQAFLTQSYGISSDAAIRLAGVTVGKVNMIDLTDQGKVKLSLLLDKEYIRFFRADSSLKIDSQLGLNNVIAGSNLLLVAGVSEIQLAAQATLEVEEPKSIEQMLDDYKITDFAEKASNILAHLEQITAAISDNQGALQTTITNVAIASQSLTESSQMLPALLSTSNDLLNTVNSSIKDIDPKLHTSIENLNRSLVTAERLMIQVESLTSTVDDVTNMTPATLDATNAALEEVRLLSQQLRGHWLLRETEMAPQSAVDLPFIYPGNWSDKSSQQTSEPPQ